MSYYAYCLEDTICAQSTPVGRGGLHVLRVSGNKAFETTRMIFTGYTKKDRPLSHHVQYGFIFNPQTQEKIDEVLVTFFERGKSYTGEETIEISCHGNPLIAARILDLLVQKGCRPADRGEFTYRAYKNKKLDLSQAEAVLSLIESKNPAFISRSLRLLSGSFSRDIKKAKEDILWAVSRLEARIDFSTEDIEIAKDNEILRKIQKAIDYLEPLIKNFESQNVLAQGVKTPIVGPPNVGKSCLFNALLGHHRSIVSEIIGTTRDYISEFINIKDVSFELIDTAGLREASDEIEKEGIDKVFKLIQESDLVLFQTDFEQFEALTTYLNQVSNKKRIVIVNKVDERTEKDIQKIKTYFSSFVTDIFFVSAQTGQGLKELEDKMVELFSLSKETSSAEVISMRQKQVIAHVLECFQKGFTILSSGESEEFILSYLNEGLKELLSLSFIEDDEIVRDKIFSEFCLGK